MSERRRLYLDSNVLAAAFGGDSRASIEIIRAAASGEFLVVASDALLDEVSRVFAKAFGSEQARRARLFFVDAPLHVIVHEAEWAGAAELLAPHARDASDLAHFAAAFVGRADALVTFNRRSVHRSMFEFVPIVVPDLVSACFARRAPWPTGEVMLDEWDRWARSSPRAPKRAGGRRA